MIIVDGMWRDHGVSAAAVDEFGPCLPEASIALMFGHALAIPVARFPSGQQPVFRNVSA